MGFIYSPEQLDYLREKRPSMNLQQLTMAFNWRFNTDKKKLSIARICQKHGWKSAIDSRFKKGYIPWNTGSKGLTSANKTSFKAGSPPVNWKPVGSERLNKYGYVVVKTAEPNIWRAKHIIAYEQHYGSVPKGYVVRVLDGDYCHTAPENLDAIPRQEHLRLNQNGYLPAPQELKPALRILAKIETCLFEKLNRVGAN